MTRLIGDSVFTRNGKPTVVVDRMSDVGQITVQREGKALDEVKKRGYINGLNQEERVAYNSIADEIHQIKNPKEKVSTLSDHLKTLKAHPKNYNLSKYIEADLAHTMITHGIHPKEYTTDEQNVR
ncbi:hypothetical protein N9D31_00915 [Oligoflexaceae bacterium]|nr:hypothetical protein [Oligoflexaceae bacterium]